MILLDASILIDYMRHHDVKLGAALDSLRPSMCGISRAEVLHGARGEKDIDRLVILLDRFPAITIPATLWDEVGRGLFQLRTRGITVPFQDAVLSVLAIELDAEIWASDKHFGRIATVLPLRLYRWPRGEAG